MQKIKKYIDFKFQKTDLIAFLALIICCILIKVLNITEIYENSVLENLQLIPLFLGAVYCFRAKDNKPFFIIAGLILILLFMRELSYGRVIYGAIPNTENEFYPLSHFKYGYLTNIIIGIYLGLTAVYGIVKKVWRDIFSLITKVKLPIWTILTLVGFVVLEILGEKADNTVIEELAELTIYCLTFSVCLIYLKVNK